jgi:hypothetical protein
LAIFLYALIINRLFREHWTYSLSYRNKEAEDREAKPGICALAINILVRKSGGVFTAKICDILAFTSFPFWWYSQYITGWCQHGILARYAMFSERIIYHNICMSGSLIALRFYY